MKARLNEVEIKDNPFEEDLLHRAQYADILTDVLSMYSEGAVIAINGEWGTGKTTFIKKWQKMLENKRFSTIYFNAWESDYIDDPLIPLIANLKKYERIDEDNTSKFEKVVKAGSKLVVAGAIGLAKGAIGSYGSEILKSGFDAVAKEANDLFKKQIESFTSQTKSMTEFKKELQDYVNKIDSEKALVYFIDELDRCSPTYAVRVLERIKHLFEIPGVVFVLSIDKEQLCNSIKGYFGGQLNSEEYLRRFIDMNYTLPKPDVNDFCKFLFDYYDFREFFDNNQRVSSVGYPKTEDKLLLQSAIIISDIKHLSLRQIDRVFSLLRLSLFEFQYNHYVFPDMYFLLVYMKVCRSDLFDKIANHGFTIQELVHIIESEFHDVLVSYDPNDYESKVADFIYTIARFIVVYSVDGNKSDKMLFTKTPDKKLMFKTEIISPQLLLEDIEFCDNGLRGGNCPLSHFTNKISLMNKFVDNNN